MKSSLLCFKVFALRTSEDLSTFSEGEPLVFRELGSSAVVFCSAIDLPHLWSVKVLSPHVSCGGQLFHTVCPEGFPLGCLGTPAVGSPPSPPPLFGQPCGATHAS